MKGLTGTELGAKKRGRQGWNGEENTRNTQKNLTWYDPGEPEFWNCILNLRRLQSMRQRHEPSFHVSRAETAHHSQEYLLGCCSKRTIIPAQDKIFSKGCTHAPTPNLAQIFPDLKGTVGPFRWITFIYKWGPWDSEGFTNILKVHS